ncbi:aminoglycoside phosphotransferase family protein [Nocardia sp. NPDC048505]|uniref:aminoglycoside phosphotransferase family protein n=1 Tax=unclassified Nocardia TaxID=2637762 RepID=UPI0033F0D1B7
MTAIEIPAAFANAATRAGSQGRDWIAALPGLVDELLHRWSCAPDGPVLHGQVGIVVPVRRDDLPPAVLKVSFPHPRNRHEPDAYAAWQGRGATHLFARADDHYAMLLERASHRTLATISDPEEALTIQGRLSHRLSIAAPPDLPRLSDRNERWADRIRSTAAAFDHPLPQRVIHAALATVRDLGPGQPAMLVHGDLHDANILASDREPWLAIDPKTYVGDPAHEALNILRSPRFAPPAPLPVPPPHPPPPPRHLLRSSPTRPHHTRRWLQFHAVREALWGRRHNDPTWLIRATDNLAEALT